MFQKKPLESNFFNTQNNTFFSANETVNQSANKINMKEKKVHEPSMDLEPRK